MFSLVHILWCFPFIFLSHVGVWAQGHDSLPQVDLGYSVHQAIAFNETAQTYNFTNIRYAQPPIGNLRFAAPVPPTGRDSQVQNGSVGRICPQASPAWGFIAQQFVPYILAGNESAFNYTRAQEQLQAYLALTAGSTAVDPRVTEDCLFLDVIVPKAIFDGAHNRYRQRNAGGAPVLVWLYGGGYTGGQKGGAYNPTGLIKASQRDGSPGIVYVALNYRLGALGWLAGPTLQGSGGVSNAGLYDQRLALEWIQENIHLFGGDPKQVTVMGESAGGGSIQHQLTAYGGREGAPFQRAIPQSPGFLPVSSQYSQENATQTFLALLNVSTIAEARELNSTAVIRANTVQVGLSPYGSFSFGPVPDGIFVPQLPGLLLNSGAFVKDIDILVGHNANEGPAFTPPNVLSQSDITAWIRSSYPGAPGPSIDYIINTLYPPVYDGTYGYRSPTQRVVFLISESSFTCNTNYINRAYGNRTYAYRFEVPPAIHGFDVQYTFYNGQGTNISQGLFAPIAEAHQAYITNFVKNGDPNGPGLVPFPMQGLNASLNGINVTGITTKRDPTVNPRCAWLQKALLS